MRIAAAVWVAALVGFAVMGAFASAHDTFPGDVWFGQQVQEVDQDAFARALDWTEDIADLPLILIVVIAASLAVLPAGGRVPALLAPVAVGVDQLVNDGLKELIGRPRPTENLLRFDDQPSSLSFPSGHAQTAMVLFGLIFYFAAIYIPDNRLRPLVQGACLWAVIVTGLERVYAGHHWPSDVIGGLLMGALLLTALIAVHRLVIAQRKA